MINWIKKNRLEFFSLCIILAAALFLRLFKIGEFMTFLGDEGRDVRIVRDLITKGNLVFIGPQTSIGNMYLGPLYYYMMAPGLLLSQLNPVGPAVMIALLGVLTVGLTWYVGRIWFNSLVGLIAALLFALSPVAIIYSRSSWNPNPMPFFALVCVWGIYEVWHHKKYRWLPIVGASFAGALQMHYLGLLLIPTLGLFWLFTLININKNKENRRPFVRQSVYAVVLFLLLMSPLLLFDIKHNWTNLNAFKMFFSDRQTTVNLNPARSDRFVPVILQTVTDLILARVPQFAVPTSIIVAISAIFVSIKTKKKQSITILFVWILFALLGLGVYKQHVYIHYLGFIYPAIYLMLGLILAYFLRKNIFFKILGVSALSFLVYLNIAHSPTFTAPNNQLQRTERVADLIIKESGGNPFNLGLIAKQNYDESYRYFLENKASSLEKDQNKITDQLFVICEDGDSCKPEGSSQYQIAVFGVAKTQQEWQVDHIKIYRLIHTK